MKTMDLEGKFLGYEKKTLAAIAVVIVVALGSFYVGAKYEKHKLGALGFLASKPTAQLKDSSHYLKGTVSAKTDKSITVKTDAGTKTIEFAPGMTFGKNGNGSAADIFVGELIVITGETDANGNFVPSNMRISKKSPKKSEVAPKTDTTTPPTDGTMTPAPTGTTSTGTTAPATTMPAPAAK